MYRAFYDASGAEQEHSEPLVVAGLLSTGNRWASFETEWENVLSDFGVPYSHMNAFAASQGPFAKWRGDEPRRRDFLTRLLSVLHRNVQYTGVFYILPAAYEAVDKDYDLAVSVGDGSRAGAYGFASLLCLRMVVRWLEKHYPRHRVQHVFESGDRGQAILAWMARQKAYPPQLRMSIEPAQDEITGEWFTPFQGADLLAYEWRKELKRRSTRSTRTPRAPLLVVKDNMVGDQGTITEARLREMCRDNPVEYPPRGVPPPTGADST